MSLTDLMSNTGLHGYAEVALIAFMIAFALIVWRTFSRRSKAAHDRAARLPFDDDETQPPTASRS
jgi:cbb3-type cytochrome oxidase subunit 3